MSYTPRYTRRNYVNNQAPSINAENLNAIEDAIVSLEANAQSEAEKVAQAATKAELVSEGQRLRTLITSVSTELSNEIEAREASEAEIRTEISKVANSNLQTSADVLDFAMDGNIQSARFEGYAYKSKNLIGTDSTKYYPCDLKTGQQITISTSDGSNISTNYNIVLHLYDANKTELDNWAIIKGTNKRTITIGNHADVKYLKMDAYSIPLQVEKGTNATSYEPYGIIKPSGVVESRTKNLCSYKDFTNGTAGGITYTREGNGIHASGTANSSETKLVEIYEVAKDGTYTISLHNNNNIIFYITVNGIEASNVTNSITGTYTKGTVIRIMLKRLYNVAINETVYVQIEKSNVVHDFEPYGKSEITLPYTPLGINNIHDELIVNEDGSGKFIKRIGTVENLGSLDWTFNGASGTLSAFTATVSDMVSVTNSDDVVRCVVSDGESVSALKSSASLGRTAIISNRRIYRWFNTSSASEAKSSVNGAILYYELATPIETALTSAQVEQILALKTFADTTYIDADGMHYEIGYAQNSAKAIKELQNIIKNLLNPQTEAVEEQISAMSDEEGEEANV